MNQTKGSYKKSLDSIVYDFSIQSFCDGDIISDFLYQKLDLSKCDCYRVAMSLTVPKPAGSKPIPRDQDRRTVFVVNVGCHPESHPCSIPFLLILNRYVIVVMSSQESGDGRRSCSGILPTAAVPALSPWE